MAQVSFLVVSPNALVSLYGLAHGPDTTVATPAEDWHQAKVDVVIPALNEEEGIIGTLASLLRQTLQPRQVILIDDGSTDRTIERAEQFAAANRMNLHVIHRASPIGKTPTIKRQAREFDSDVEFILDADTFLDSPNYIQRTVQELYQAAGIASACGVIVPMRQRDMMRVLDWPPVQAWQAAHPDTSLAPNHSVWRRMGRGFTNVYREALYTFLQKFVYRGQMVMFGTITNPIGCAVAYRRKYVKDLFDRYEPLLGDDLTNSEDIFIGFAMLAQGYRNIQLEDVSAHTREPEARRLPHQVFMWSSSFLQSCYYFDPLLRSPFKALKRWWHEREGRKHAKEIQQLRKIKEPYRQPWGLDYTAKYGRPIGWTLLMSAIEKVCFPIVLLAMVVTRHWNALAITVGIESFLVLFALGVVSRGHRLEYLLKGILVTPVRYAYILWELVTMMRFAIDVWLRRNRKWRK